MIAAFARPTLARVTATGEPGRWAVVAEWLDGDGWRRAEVCSAARTQTAAIERGRRLLPRVYRLALRGAR